MKLSELMAGRSPNPAFEGFVTNDDYVLAVDCSVDGKAAVGDYAVVQMKKLYGANECGRTTQRGS